MNLKTTKSVPTRKRKTASKSISNCMDCAEHLVLNDPDPYDWFDDDDEKVVCKAKRNREITGACRPYNKRKECKRPDWCPLRAAK